MDVSTIIGMARSDCNISSTRTKFADSSLLPYLNLVYHTIENSISTRIDEDYFSGEMTTDIVGGQNRYQRRESTSTQEGFKKIIELHIKYSSNATNYSKVDRNSIELDNRTDDFLETNQPSSSAFYDIEGQYITLYPTPTENVTNGLKAKVLKNLVDLSLGDSESAVFPRHTELRQYHKILVSGLRPYIYQLKGELDKKQFAKQEHEQELEMMIMELSNRVYGPAIGTTPSSLYLEE